MITASNTPNARETTPSEKAMHWVQSRSNEKLHQTKLSYGMAMMTPGVAVLVISALAKTL
jgi:hypothetical protein